MQPVPGHGGASRGVCGLRGEQRHGCAEIVCVRDGEHGAPEAHPGLGDDLRVDPVVLGRPGKHLPGALHRLPGQISGIDPLRPAPAHDEGADAVLLVRDDQGGVACLPGQCAGIVQTVLHPPADPDLALLAGPDSPAEGFSDIHAEIQPVGSEPVFLPALHGGSLLLGRLATVSARATPTLPCRAAHPYQPFPLQGTILRRQRPPGLLRGRDRGPSGGGRPAVPRGAIYTVREIKDMALLKTLQLGERSSGAISDCNGDRDSLRWSRRRFCTTRPRWREPRRPCH